MADKPPFACHNCGATYEFSEGSFPLVVISDTSIGQLRALFAKQPDEYPCRGCSKQIGLRPTVVIVIGHKKERLYSLGDHLIAAPDQIRKTFLDGLKSRGARVEAYGTLDDMRAAYARRIVSIIHHVLQGLQAMSSDHKVLTPGTVIWSAPGDGSGVASIVPAVPKKLTQLFGRVKISTNTS